MKTEIKILKESAENQKEIFSLRQRMVDYYEGQIDVLGMLEKIEDTESGDTGQKLSKFKDFVLDLLEVLLSKSLVAFETVEIQNMIKKVKEFV